MQEDFVLFDSPPTSVEFDSLLASDMNGLYYCRLVAATLVSVAILFTIYYLLLITPPKKKKKKIFIYLLFKENIK